MASLEDVKVLHETWTKSVESAAKAGYKDGAYDGQQSTYQTCFDMGYTQGLNFGINLGLQVANKSIHSANLITANHYATTNCQICLKGTLSQEDNMVNLFNNQQEKNESFLKTYQ